MQNTETSAAPRLMSLPLEIKADGTSGSFEGYGAIFGNKDRDGDIVARGAFAESLKAGMPALLWQHDQKAPIGRFDEVREDDKGLYVKGQLVMQGRGLEAYELLKMDALNGLSIGFVTKEASRDPATNTRTIRKADLMEISLVTFPANELARVNSVKAAFMKDAEANKPEAPVADARSFERMLRDNGFSRSRAKAITAKGFKAISLGRDENTEIANMVAELKARQGVLEQKGTKSKNVPAKSTGFGDWVSFGKFSAATPMEFKLKASARGPKHLTGPFELEVKYKSGSGMKIGKYPMEKRFRIPAGSQEIFVRARSMQALVQYIWVTVIL